VTGTATVPTPVMRVVPVIASSCGRGVTWISKLAS
jgi:hypothetical protein